MQRPIFRFFTQILRNKLNCHISDENGIVRTGFYRTDKGYSLLSWFSDNIFLPTNLEGNWRKALSLWKSTLIREICTAPSNHNQSNTRKDGKTYVIDENGVATEKWIKVNEQDISPL